MKLYESVADAELQRAEEMHRRDVAAAEAAAGSTSIGVSGNSKEDSPVVVAILSPTRDRT